MTEPDTKEEKKLKRLIVFKQSFSFFSFFTQQNRTQKQKA